MEYNKEVLTIDDIMSILHIGRNTVYKLLKEGVIKSIKVGKRYIVPRKAITDFLSVQ